MDRSVYRRMAEQEDRHWWFRGRRRIVAGLVERFIPRRPRPRILEVGCGTGGNLHMLARFGALEAVEYDAEARILAAQKGGIPIGACALPDHVEAASAAYDLVVLLDVLEHVQDDVAALRRLRAALAPGGRLLVTVPALQWLWSAHDELHHHYRRYDRATLARHAEAAGLKVVAAGYFCTLLLPLIALVRLTKRATGAGGADDHLPAAPLNAVLGRIFGLERALLGRRGLAVGSSLFLVAEAG